MAYIGRDIEQGLFTKQTFTADSSTTVFTLSHAVVSANNLLVSVGGVIQEPDSAYTASGTVLTFTGIPTTGDLIWVVYLGKSGSSATTRGAIVKQTGVGDGTTTPITLSTSAVNSASIIVTLNGVVQVPDTDFVASGTTLTFTTAPSAALAILVYFLSGKARLGKPAAGSVTAATLASSGTLPTANGSALTGVLSHADLNVLRTNIALAGFNRSTDHATTVLGMPNGFIDQFEDQTGVDDPSSAYESYDATGDYYSATYTVDNHFTDTLNADDPNYINLTLRQIIPVGSIDGTQIRITLEASTTHNQVIDNISIGPRSGSTGNCTVTPTEFLFSSSSGVSISTSATAISDWLNFTFDSSLEHLVCIDFSGDAQSIRRITSGGPGWYHIGGDNNSYNTAVLAGTSLQSSQTAVVVKIEVRNLNNMTLISETSTASASPDNAHIALFNEEVDALTLDTDIMAWASRSKQTFTATNATNVLNATGHGLSNGDRVMLTGSTQVAGNMIPVMGNLTSPSGTVSANGELSGNEAWRAFDSNTSGTLWNVNTNTGYLQFAFNNGLTAKVIAAYDLWNFTTAAAPVNWTIQASNTGAFGGEQVTLHTVTGASWGTANELKQYTFSNTTSYIFYRMNITLNGGGADTAIASLQLIVANEYSNLPTGLTSEPVYYVVNKTTNTFKVSLTSGGAAVALTDDGTETHSVRVVTKASLVDRGDFETGKATLSALVDISGQPTDTDMSLIVQTKNNKATKLHGMSMQYT